MGVLGPIWEGPRTPQAVPKGPFWPILAGTARTPIQGTVFGCFHRKQPKGGARDVSSQKPGTSGGQLSAFRALLFQNSDYEK